MGARGALHCPGIIYSSGIGPILVMLIICSVRICSAQGIIVMEPQLALIFHKIRRFSEGIG